MNILNKAFGNLSKRMELRKLAEKMRNYCEKIEACIDNNECEDIDVWVRKLDECTNKLLEKRKEFDLDV